MHWLFLSLFLLTTELGTKGLIPVALHVDGAEFYSNSEYLVWSMASVLSEAHVWDCKFPLCILPHDSMATDEVKKQVHTLVAKVVAWSLHHAACGRAPSCGFNGEPLSGVRAELAGKPLASSWRMCFFGFRFDEKARKETNFFQRSYQHSLICMNCMAQKKHKGWIPELSYKNFHPSAVHRMTPVSFLPIDP